jgi:hypothetical protein
MIYFALVLFCVVFGLFFIRLVYLSSISAVKIVATDHTYIDYLVVPVKPNKKFFKSVSAGLSSSFVSLGNGYYAYYVNDSDVCLTYNTFEFSSDVYIFKRSRFGRYSSIDLADRCLNDIINKFKGV